MMDDYRNFAPERILPVPCKEAVAERFMAVSDDRLSSQIFHDDGDKFDAVVTSPFKHFKYSTLVKSPEAHLYISIRDNVKQFNKNLNTQKTNCREFASPEHTVDTRKLDINYKKCMPAISLTSPLQCVGHHNQDKSRFAEGALITKFYSEGSIFLKKSIDDVNEQNLKEKLKTIHNASIIPTSKKCKARIYVAKSILAIHEKEKFRNHNANCKHEEDHCEIKNPKQLGKCNSVRIMTSNINRSLNDHDYNGDDLSAVLKRVLSLDQSLNSNIHYRDVSAINKNVNYRTIISKNCSFLRERKLSKLRCSQFNRLIHQVLH